MYLSLAYRYSNALAMTSRSKTNTKTYFFLFFFPAVVEILGSDPYIENFGVSFGSSVAVDLAVDAFFWCGLVVLNTAALVGVLRLRGWGRWLAIGLVSPGVILFPLGLSPSPVLFMGGALMIWYLLFSKKAKRAFGAPLPEATP